MGHGMPRCLVRGRIAAALVSSLSLVAIAASVSSASGARASCSVEAGTTLKRTDAVRIFAFNGSADAQRPVFACLKRFAVGRRLGPIDDNPEFFGNSMAGPFGIAAPWAGGIEARYGVQDSFYFYAAGRDLRTGLSRHCLIVGSNRPFAGPNHLLINRNGVMAWGVVAPSSRTTVEVGFCGREGRHIVARESGIALGSLELHGSTLSWTASGTEASTEVH